MTGKLKRHDGNWKEIEKKTGKKQNKTKQKESLIIIIPKKERREKRAKIEEKDEMKIATLKLKKKK